MSIGEALAEARRQAGLTVTQVSQKTRIREAIIRDIERDDYSTCGGDFYARGHIRAIARAVGADSGPLIQEYDAARRRADEVAAPAESGPNGLGPARFAAAGEPGPAGFGPAEEPGPGGFAPWETAPGRLAPGEFAPARYQADGFVAPGEFGPDGFATTPGEFGPDGFATTPGEFGPEGFTAPGEFGPEGFTAPGEFGPDGVTAPGEFGPDGFTAPGEFGPGGFTAPAEFGPGGVTAPGEFGPGGVTAPGEFGPDGVTAPAEFGPGGVTAPGEFATVEYEPVDFAAPDEFEAPEEITSPNQIATSQIAALDDIMGSRRTPAPEESTAPQYRPPATPAGARTPRRPDPAAANRPRRPDRAAARRSPALAGATGLRRPDQTGARGLRRPDRGAVRGRRPPNRAAVLAAGLLAVLGLILYLVIPGSRTARPAGSAAAAGSARHRHAARSSSHPTAAHSPATPARSAPPTAAPQRARAAALIPVRVVAFGPGGPGQGDNPQGARLAIDRSLATAWHSAWYATSHFGNLQAGTGLLLDMGHPVTITTARVILGSAPGADLQLRVGGAAALGDLRRVASAVNAHDRVRLQLAKPASARYVLIWFTRLPPDPAGTYQVAVHNIRLW